MEPEARPAPAAPVSSPQEARPASSAADAAMRAYVGYLAGWFDLGQLAAGRRLERNGVDAPLLTDL
jgi:hypothetical protein